MNSLKIAQEALKKARMQFCLDIGLPWNIYENNPNDTVYICRARYKEGTKHVNAEGARVYEGRDDFFHAIICLGQLFLVVDEQIYDWAVEKFKNCKPEWFCSFGNLRMIEEKLQEYGHCIADTHVYMLPEECEKSEVRDAELQWYDQKEILKFKEGNIFTSAICFSQSQPDMIAVAAVEEDSVAGKCYDQSKMNGMAGVSADGMYLWQIGINVVPEARGKSLASKLVRELKEEVLKQSKIPFYGTSESHSISQTVGLKAGFVPAWTEVYVKKTDM